MPAPLRADRAGAAGYVGHRRNQAAEAGRLSDDHREHAGRDRVAGDTEQIIRKLFYTLRDATGGRPHSEIGASLNTAILVLGAGRSQVRPNALDELAMFADKPHRIVDSDNALPQLKGARHTQPLPELLDKPHRQIVTVNPQVLNQSLIAADLISGNEQKV